MDEKHYMSRPLQQRLRGAGPRGGPVDGGSARWENRLVLRLHSPAGVSAAAVMVAACWTLAAGTPAHATFPGRNGAFLVPGTSMAGCAQPTFSDSPGAPECFSDVDHSIPRADTLFLADPRTQTVRPLVPGRPIRSEASAYDPVGQFSPDGRSVVVASKTVQDPRLRGISIFSTNPAIKPKPLHVHGLDVTWSPDGRSIAYWNWNYDLFTLNLRHGTPRLIRDFAAGPDWSTRNIIAFADTDNERKPCGQHSLCLMRPDGSGVRLPRFRPDGARWSPHGYRFVGSEYSAAGNSSRVVIGCPNGTGVRAITTYVRGTEGVGATWSPDGRTIAISYNNSIYEVSANPRHPQPPSSWRRIMSGRYVVDWQPLRPGPERPRTPAHVCR